MIISLKRLDLLPQRPSIVTWGIFDGVHIGHQRVIAEVVNWANSIDAISVLLTFDQHPENLLYGRSIPWLLRLEKRLDIIESLGIKYVVLAPFTLKFARTQAETFIKQMIVERLRGRGIVLGFDPSFGKDRKGDLRMLEELAMGLRIEIRTCQPEMFGKRVVSSSLIRELIQKGYLDEAVFLLTRPVNVSGRVVIGDKRGRSLGFPTANIDVTHHVIPPGGVYACEVHLDGRDYLGVTNIGKRPTFYRGKDKDVLETHILGIDDRDLYGKLVDIDFLFKIRGERRFKGPKELRDQIAADISALIYSGR
jgi:riboflavin kinase/FMN adenylyltransferase